MIKDTGLMTPRRFNIKPLSENTQPKSKLELNAEIIARAKAIHDAGNHLESQGSVRKNKKEHFEW